MTATPLAPMAGDGYVAQHMAGDGYVAGTVKRLGED